MTFGVRRFRRLLFVSCAALVETNLLDCTDTIIIGHLLGDAGLGALGLFWPCLEFICFFATLIAGGTAVNFSNAVGQFRDERASGIFSSGFFAILGLGLLLSLGMFFGCDTCCRLLGAGPETIVHLRPYLRVFSINALLLPMSIYLATMVCADGDGSICTLGFVLELVVNGVASYFFCLKWGAAGCALGTVAGTVASLCALPFHFLSPGNSLKLRLRFRFEYVWSALRTDFSESSDMLFTGLLYLSMNHVLVYSFGDGAATVMAAVIMANAFTYFLYGVAKAAQPIVGVSFGERNYAAVREVMRDALAWSLVLGGTVSALFAVYPELPVGLAGVDSPELVARSVTAVRVVSLGFFTVAVSALFVSYFIFIERPGISMFLAVLQGAVCPVLGCVFGVASGAGERGFWIGYTLATPAALAIVAIFLVVRREGRLLPFLLPHDRDARIWSWNTAKLTEAEACRIAQSLRQTLQENGVEPRQVIRAAMLVEDSLVETVSRNPNRTVDAEVTLDLNDGVQIAFRDGGVVSVLEGMAVSPADTLRSEVIKKLGRTLAGNHTLVTTGFNRKTIKI